MIVLLSSGELLLSRELNPVSVGRKPEAEGRQCRERVANVAQGKLDHEVLPPFV